MSSAATDATPLAEQLVRAGLDWIVPDWDAPSAVQALVTTRQGEAVPGAPATREGGRDRAAGVTVPDRDGRLRAFVPAEPRWLRQVHGARVVTLDASGAADPPPLADAAVTATPGIVCVVRAADCLPVLLADRAGTAVGVAHAGWRGLAGGVIEATAGALADLGVPAERLVAWLGPAIGAGAFEVGRDVLEAFMASDPGAAGCFVPGAPGKWHADLYGLARRRLAGLGTRNIRGGDFCTHTDSQRFFSHRRGRDPGRMAALIWLAP